MNNFKGLKIAIIAGQNVEGCGVQRIGTELLNYCSAHEMQTEFYAYDTGVKYSRANGHGTKYISFKPKDIPQLVCKLNTYDIIIFISYPHYKLDHTVIKEFYYNFYSKLTKPIKVIYNLEIMKGNIDRIAYLGPIVNTGDVVFHYGLDTWFSKIVDTLGIKKIGDRLHRFHLWMDFSELDEYKKLFPLNKKQKGLVSVTRWSSLKNIGRTIDIQRNLLSMNTGWFCAVHGVERSIGAKFDILDRPDIYYNNPSGKIDGPGPVNIYGPIVRNDGLKLMAQNLFSSSFFSLPKNPWDYGNRHEYSQIENAYLSIPLFDKHWSENNYNKHGVKFGDIKYAAIYSDDKDIKEVSEFLEDLSNNKTELKRYSETAAKVVKDEYDSNIVIPQALELILSKGKQINISDDYEFNKKIANEEFANEILKLEESNEVPILGLCEYEKQEVYKLNGKKQELVKRCKTKSSKKSIIVNKTKAVTKELF